MNKDNSNSERHSHSENEFDQEDSHSEQPLNDNIVQYLAIGILVKQWFEDLIALSQLEFERSTVAIRSSIYYQILLLPLCILLYISLVASVGMLTYLYSNNAPAGIASALIFQLLFIGLIKYTISNVRKNIGFENTLNHIKEAKNEIHKAFKQTNKDSKPTST